MDQRAQEVSRERRLSLDTIMKGAELLDDGADEERRLIALVALMRLGDPDAALALLRDMWPNGRIGTPAACWVINRTLESGNPAYQEEALGILVANGKQLVTNDRIYYVGRTTEVHWAALVRDPLARRRILLAYTIAAGAIGAVADNEGVAEEWVSLAELLLWQASREPVALNRNELLFTAGKLLAGIPNMPGAAIVTSARRAVTLSELRDEASGISANWEPSHQLKTALPALSPR